MREVLANLGIDPVPDLNINGTPGPDVLTGTDEPDRINGLAGDDVIRGLSGTDRIDGGPGLDDMDAGLGDIDVLDYTTANRGWTINLQAGTATNGFITERAVNFESALGTDFDDVLIGSTGENRLQGGDGNDRIDGGAGDDQLFGGAGDDFVTGGDGVDRFDGGPGIDTLSYAGAPGTIIIDLSVGLTANGAFNERADFFENAIGTAGNDSLFGSEGDNVLDGGTAGRDRFVGAGGVDTLSYVSNARGVIIDLDVGQAFDGLDLDTFAEIEWATGSAFDDTIYASNSALGNRIDPGPGGTDRLFGGPRFDTLSYASSARAVIVDFSVGLSFDGISQDQFSDFEAVIGSAFGDQIFGSNGNDDLDGGAGDDRISGSVGNDTLRGGAGDDLLFGEAGSDRIEGGPGIDTASYATSLNSVNIVLGISAFDGFDSDTLIDIENLVGSAQDDNLRGNANANVIDGGSGGADELDGSVGFDVLTYASAVRGIVIDLLAQTGDDGVARDRVRNFESVIGTRFNDRITGTNAADTIDGGADGADILDGLLGVDTVSYASSVRGVIVDLSAGLSFDGQLQDTLAGFENARGSALNDSFFGNALANSFMGGAGVDRLQGEAGNDTLDGGPGADSYTGGSGNDDFVLRRGEVQGDVIEDFQGNGAAAGDRIRLIGYDPGSGVVLIDAATSTYRVTDGLDNFSETFRLIGAYDPPSDTLFG